MQATLVILACLIAAPPATGHDPEGRREAGCARFASTTPLTLEACHALGDDVSLLWEANHPGWQAVAWTCRVNGEDT